LCASKKFRFKVSGACRLYVHGRVCYSLIQQEAGSYAQVSSMLHALGKLSFSAFVGFCECLLETGQTSIVVDFLTPELNDLQQQRQSQPRHASLNVDVRGEAASTEALGVVDWRPGATNMHIAGRVEPATAASTTVVHFDWKSVIRDNFMQLSQHIDPDAGLLEQLQSRGVISDVSADVIRVYAI